MAHDHPDLLLYPKSTDFSRQGIELPGTKRPGQTGSYVNATWPAIPNAASLTLWDLFQSGLNRHPDHPCLGHRRILSKHPLKYAHEYVWQTYTEVDRRRRHVGSALELLWREGRAGGGDLPSVGIWSANRPEWQIVDLACQIYGKVSVSLYDTLGPDAVEFICNHAEISVVCVAGQQLPTLLKVFHKLPKLKVIICFDQLEPETRTLALSWTASRNVEFFELLEFEKLGGENLAEPSLPSPNQVYSLCYTSGTTGNPKGVVLRNNQVAISVMAAIRGQYFTDPGALLSFLPLAHIYGRVAEFGVLRLGGAIGYYTGDPSRLLEEVQLIRPTFFPAVPRVLNKIYQAAMAMGDVPGLRGAIFRKAVQTKLENLHERGEFTHPLWDRLVFRKIRNVLGGRIQSIATGSAPISPDVLDFFKIAFGDQVLEGYGMTENSAICTRAIAGDPTSTGTVGPPQPMVEIKLVDVPQMGYTVEDKPNARGELCCKGAVVFTEYYKDPAKTKEAIDEEGWLHTGDVAEVDSCGRFRIVDRIKNIMKLSQGEYVALERVENAYSGSPLIAQVYVHGESLQDYLVGVVVPEPVQLCAMAHKLLGQTVTPDDAAALARIAKDSKIRSFLQAEINRLGKRAGLKGFEQVKKIYVTTEMFTPENDTLTPTLKLKRKAAYELHKPAIDALYINTSDVTQAKL